MENTDNEFKVIQGIRSCGYSVFTNVFTHFKYNISEMEFYFLSNGMSYEYISNPDCYFGYFSFFNEVSHAQKNITSRIEYYNELEDNRKKQIIIEALKKKAMAVISIHPCCLEYHKITEIRNPYHVLLIYGFAEEKESVFIGDTYIVSDTGVVSSYQGAIELNKLIPNIKEISVLEKEEQWTSRARISDKLLAENVILALENFINPEISSEVFRGYMSIERFLTDLKGMILDDFDLFSQSFQNIAATFKWVRISPLFGYLKDFISQDIKLQNQQKENLIQQMEQLETEWRKIVDRLLKIGYSGKKDNIYPILEKNDELLMRLKEVFHALIREIKTVYGIS